MSLNIVVDIDTKKVANRLINDKVKLFANQEASRLLDPFVPFRKGNLSQNKVITSEYIHYKSPYAKRIYNGKGLNFNKDYHPLATAYWDKVGMVSQKDKLVKAIENYMQKGV